MAGDFRTARDTKKNSISPLMADLIFVSLALAHSVSFVFVRNFLHKYGFTYVESRFYTRTLTVMVVMIVTVATNSRNSNGSNKSCVAEHCRTSRPARVNGYAGSDCGL